MLYRFDLSEGIWYFIQVNTYEEMDSADQFYRDYKKGNNGSKRKKKNRNQCPLRMDMQLILLYLTLRFLFCLRQNLLRWFLSLCPRRLIAIFAHVLRINIRIFAPILGAIRIGISSAPPLRS